MNNLNSRQAIELGDILREEEGTYPYKLSKEQHKAEKSIVSCRTKELA